MSEKQEAGSDERSPAVSPPDVPVRFGRGELNAFLNRDAEPPTPDDRTILAGAEDRPATEDELRALADRLRADRDAAQAAG
jgi:hypothetical protein